MGRSNILKLEIMAKEREYYCSDCDDDWVVTQEETEVTCTQCNGSNIRETT